MGYVCIHGHFYQPPRENPWLEAIELQDSAYPYHDWNERISAECYASNSAARILNSEDQIIRIVNNYEKISFNFGPTLLSWMEAKAPKIYRAILDADHASRERFSGHGSAIAQAYHHMIMPLANRRDKRTQVVWGIRDFEHRFGRAPEGMWLPETAVDTETLELLAEFGIKFTILAPSQASREAKIAGHSWKDASGGRIDPSMAYRLDLPSGRKINLFFYDGPISRAVAFEDLLANGERFAQRLMAGFAEETRPWPELVHIATDGETYGHHHRRGEMALAYALDYIASNELAEITNYGEYLERHPPIHRAEIIENSSWSCVHGIERWRSNCGCNSGGHPGWNQEWRAPLRQALDWLRDTLAPQYEERAHSLLRDPWAARADYIQVVLDRSPESVEHFLGKHARQSLGEDDKVTALKLLELQRHAMLMYTSCGWFFDELSGIETVQVMHYAGRAVHLAQQVFADGIESAFLEKLSEAKSNLPEHRDGAYIYNEFVKPAVVDLLKVGGHYAISLMFKSFPEQAHIYCYAVDGEEYSTHDQGKMKLAIGRARFTSQITQECSTLSFGVIHFGDHNVKGGVRECLGPEAHQSLVKNLAEAFAHAGTSELLQRLEEGFGGNIQSLQALFRDEQRQILGLVMDSVLAETEAAHRQIYEQHAELMRFLVALGIPVPRAFRASAEFALNSYLRQAFAGEELDRERVHGLLREATAVNVDLDVATLEYTLRKNIERLAELVSTRSGDLGLLGRLTRAVGLACSLPFSVDLWQVQNFCYHELGTSYRERRSKAEEGDEAGQAWLKLFAQLTEQLSFTGEMKQ